MKGQLKILIIDDDELGNETLKLLLKDILTQKVDVDSIYSGKNAVSLIEQNKYDLVFLDNKLPDITGLEVLKQIKEKNIKTVLRLESGFLFCFSMQTLRFLFSTQRCQAAELV